MSPPGLVEPSGHRWTVHPAELDLVRRLAPHLEQPFVECRMVATAQKCQIPQLVRATARLLDDVMDVEVPRGAAAGHRAAMMIAREHLLAHPRRHRRRRALRCRRLERADDPGVARRTLERLRGDVDLAPGAVLGRAAAIRALLVSDLVPGPLGTGPRRDHGAAQRLDELGVAELAAVLRGD